MTERTILVTGASGLVGQGLRTVAPEVGKDGDKFIWLSSKDGDLRNLEECRAVFKKYKPTHVIHLAAFVGGLFRNMKFPADFWHNNITMNNNVLQCAYETTVQENKENNVKVEKVISCLSTCIFPDKTTYPIDETMVHNGPPHQSNYAYAYAKRMVDIANRSYHQQHGCKFTSIIPTNIYGPHDNFHIENGHVIPGLIHKFYLAEKSKKPVQECRGTGIDLRQFIYSEDLAKLILLVLEHYDDAEPIILSVGEEDEVTIKEVVETVKRTIGFEGELQWGDASDNGQYKKTASNTKLLNLLQEKNVDFEFTSIQDGIEKTVQWFRDNYESARK